MNKKVNWLDRRIAHPGPYLCLCLTEAEFLAATSHLKIKDAGSWIKTTQADATTHWMEHPAKGLCAVVCLSNWEGRPGPFAGVEIAGMLVHEAVHVWQKYADYIGEQHPGTEQEAYAVQAIAQELMAEFARRVAKP